MRDGGIGAQVHLLQQLDRFGKVCFRSLGNVYLSMALVMSVFQNDSVTFTIRHGRRLAVNASTRRRLYFAVVQNSPPCTVRRRSKFAAVFDLLSVVWMMCLNLSSTYRLVCPVYGP